MPCACGYIREPMEPRIHCFPTRRPDEPINGQLFSSSPGNTRKHCDGTVTTTAPKIDFEVHKRCPICGHGNAVQIMAEKAEAGFRPTSRAMQKLNFRSSTNICGYFSVDSFWSIHEFVASEFGQLIVNGSDREQAHREMVLTLKDLSIHGDISTTMDVISKLTEFDDNINHDIHTGWLDKLIQAGSFESNVQLMRGGKKALNNHPHVNIGATVFGYDRCLYGEKQFIELLQKGRLPSLSLLNMEHNVEPTLEQSTSHPISTAPVIKAFASQPAPTILNLWSITVQKRVALNPALIQSFKSNQNPSAKPSMLPSSKPSHNPSATLSKDPSKPCQKLITKPSQAPLDPQLSPSGSHYPCPDTTHRIYFTKNFYTTDTSSTAYLSRPVFHSPLIHTNLDFYHDFDIASRVALSAPFGIASLLQSVFHPTTLSSYYPEHIITLSSNDSELERDYIAHCTAYSHLTQAICN